MKAAARSQRGWRPKETVASRQPEPPSRRRSSSLLLGQFLGGQLRLAFSLQPWQECGLLLPFAAATSARGRA